MTARAQVTVCHDGLVGPLLDRVRAACADWAAVVPLPEAAAPEAFRTEVLRSCVVIGWPIQPMPGSLSVSKPSTFGSSRTRSATARTAPK